MLVLFSFATLTLKKTEKAVILAILLGALLLMILWLLLAPISVKIDTWQQDYAVRWQGIGGVQVLLIENEVVLLLRVFFWRKAFYPLRGSKKPSKPPKKSKPTTQRKGGIFSWKLAKRVLRTFRIKQFKLELDTDDYVINAFLYPVFYFLDSPKRQLRVNFEGRTNLLLHIENRLSRIIGAIIPIFFSKKISKP